MGVTNTAVTLAAYAIVLGVGLPVPVAAVAGWTAGAVNGYRLNRAWTFHSALTGAAVRPRAMSPWRGLARASTRSGRRSLSATSTCRASRARSPSFRR